MDSKQKPSNGRVNIFAPKTTDLFQMYDKIPVNQCVTFRNPTEGLWDDTQLSKPFFSHENITKIQRGIQMGVYQKSNGQYSIGYQDQATLNIIMRSVFLQSAMNLPTNIGEQVKNLNAIVLNYCIPQVYSAAQGHMKYMYDVSTIAMPIDHPVYMKENDKQLELQPWF